MHAANTYTEPLDILLMIANDPELPADLRARAAKDASVYVHKRKPIGIEISGKYEFLSPEEREMRRNLLLEEIRERQVKNAGSGPNRGD